MIAAVVQKRLGELAKEKEVKVFEILNQMDIDDIYKKEPLIYTPPEIDAQKARPIDGSQ